MPAVEPNTTKLTFSGQRCVETLPLALMSIRFSHLASLVLLLPLTPVMMWMDWNSKPVNWPSVVGEVTEVTAHNRFVPGDEYHSPYDELQIEAVAQYTVDENTYQRDLPTLY